MWGQEDHSHWRSLIHQPQTAELNRSSGGRGSDELRRRDQQDVRIRWGSAQVCLPPTKQDQSRFSSEPWLLHQLSSARVLVWNKQRESGPNVW
ncbi:unnamed protein product [Boreogadus saida]